MIVMIGGGSHAGLSFAQGLFLAGDMIRIQEYITYLEFEEARQKVREIMTTPFDDVTEQLRELSRCYPNYPDISMLKSAMEAARASKEASKLHDIIKKIEKTYIDRYIDKEPLPRPHKIIPAFNVYHAYKGRLSHKPRYYHTRSNC